jgi:5-methylcytosine-specific restriction enzyme A
MALSDITYENVLAAIKEHDEIGSEAFLTKYGFGKSKAYLIEHERSFYDSKAIVGVAHSFARPEIGPLDRAKFSGGKTAATKVLEALGFKIFVKDKPPPRNPNWTRDELILAVEFYKKHAPSIPGKTDSRLIETSHEIRAVAESLGLHGDETFRNPNGVYMKLMELRKYDPKYSGKGLGRSLRPIEQEVWDLSNNAIASTTKLIRAALVEIEHGDNARTIIADAWEPEIVDAAEGALVTRLHRYRERSRKIANDKKKQFLKSHGTLFCEACGFDFAKTYGERGNGFIECHHTIPVSTMEPGRKTKLSELALVCANCHRMIHSKRPWLQIEELRALLTP